jgi:hypothetical protein
MFVTDTAQAMKTLPKPIENLNKTSMKEFNATLDIIGINPFVFVPEAILSDLFSQANKSKGHIPVCGTVNGKNYTQTLVRYLDEWRLYINTSMLKNSPKRIGELLTITIQYDPTDRTLVPNARFIEALNKDTSAKSTFESLSPSRQKEIIRYLSSLKSEESLDKNIEKAIGFLNGANAFLGRKNPV